MDREQFQLRYKPLTPAKFPDQDFTISTTGRERFAAARVGETEVTVHDLMDGNVTQTFSLSQDLKVMKLAIVHLDQFSILLYLLTWQGDQKTSLQGMLYDLDTQKFTVHLHLHQHFDCHAGFFSLFTEHGLLMSGKSVDESDPLLFTLVCWNYSGEKIYCFSFYSEYGLCLAECKYRALVTPRALNYLYHTADNMIISQRTHRGASVLCFSWPGEFSQLWKVNSVMEAFPPGAIFSLLGVRWGASCVQWLEQGILL